MTALTPLPEHSRAVLCEDRPEAGLRVGDVGTVVHVYSEGAGYEVEFVAQSGHTVAVLTLPSAAVRAVEPTEELVARVLAA